MSVYTSVYASRQREPTELLARLVELRRTVSTFFVRPPCSVVAKRPTIFAA